MKYTIGQELPQTKKHVRHVALTVSLLLILMIGGGVGYVYWAGKQVPEEDVLSATTELATPDLFKPHAPDPNNPVGASVQSLTSPIKPGSNASIQVRTTPTAECTIEVEYDGVKSDDSGLIPKAANEYGMVGWVWSVESSAPEGTWPVGVTCSYAEKSGFVQGNLVLDAEAKPFN